MATYRAQIAFALDTALPRDACVITPHYTGSDPQALADGLKSNLIANPHVTSIVPFTVNIYDATGPKPHHPIGTASSGTGAAAGSGPREVSLCLSYYAGLNQPRLRGRLYIPQAFFGAPSATRPTGTQITTAMSFGPTLGKTLPTGVKWVVWSRVTSTAHDVTNYWVDDEWDTIRSRGLKSTTRQLGTIP